MNNPFKKDKKQLSIFITAGFPELNSTVDQIVELQKKGVDFLEIGIPFSDPMADGPVIQESSMVALKNGMNMDILFTQLQERKNEIKIPLVLMGYLNPVLQYGVDRFLVNCKKADITSVILPDLSVELYERFYRFTFEKYDVPITFLVTPFTEQARIKKIAEVCKNSFVYLVSKTSITGEKHSIDSEIIKGYQNVKAICGEVPVMMGFGISTTEDIERAYQYSDGAIIGTAYLNCLMNKKEPAFLPVNFM